MTGSQGRKTHRVVWSANLDFSNILADKSGCKMSNRVRMRLDFEKAFDSFEWDFLEKCLEEFNSGPDFRR